MSLVFKGHFLRILLAWVLAAAAAIVAAACSSSSTTSTGPSPTKCQVALDATPKSFVAGGGRGTVSVSTQPECAWTAAAQASWVSDLNPASGQGPGQFTFQVPANPLTVARQSELDVNGTRVPVAQEAAACPYTLTPTSLSVGAAGGADNAVGVATTTGCAWTAASAVPWITVTAGATGNGNGSVRFTIAANTGGQRTGTLTIAGQTFTVTQVAAVAAGCAYTIAPIGQSIGAAAGAGSPIAVSTTAACAWTAVSGVPWITVTSGAAGTGNGSVGFSVAANTGAERTGTLTIGSQTFTVTQAAAATSVPCAYQVTPLAQSFAAAGGAGTPISVATTSACTWAAVSADSWITVTSDASGSGNGSVEFSVAGNTAAARTGTLTVAGQTFTVTQAAAPPCNYSINPSSQSIGAAGGPGTTAVTTAPGCAWTASINSNPLWLTLTSGASGSGNGTVSFSSAPNTGPQRTALMTIAGQTLTVTQAAGCIYTIAPTSQAIGSAGGLGTVAVSTAADCQWTVVNNTSGPEWITVTSGVNGGTGNGNVGFIAAANTGAARSGTLTIAGQTFTVTQAAAVVTCNYSINPNGQSIGAAGGPGTTAVTSAAGCTWTAVTNSPPWLTVTSGASGSGNGPVGFSVAANAGPQRIGMLTIAGQTLTVTQASGCAYTIAPTSQAVGLLGGTGTVAVTTAAGCAWTVVNNTSGPAWITVTSGGNGGTGNGTVAFSAAANPTPRNGTLTIAGQTFTVIQRLVP
jgi:hypothetical protein